MKIAYTSRRPFTDGPVTAPFPENDPANIAYLLGGDYFSFFTLQKLSPARLRQTLAPYDLIFVPLDLRALDSVQQITAASNGRYVTYSEGNIADYQMHDPAGQATYLRILRQARLNCLYWEKYIPFYRSLTDQPVEYLPYPYFIHEASQYHVPPQQRPLHVTLPSGLAGATRNGLASLAVARRLLQEKQITQINCWLSAVTFAEDAQAVRYFLHHTPFTPVRQRFNWRRWLQKSGLDYRALLRLKQQQKPTEAPPPPLVQTDGLALYRRRTWLHYIPEMARTRLVIDLNNRETVGRNAQDCAAVGVPCLSTDRSDMQPRLFPALTLRDSWDVETAVSLCHRLLTDTDFYQEVTTTAATNLAQFGPDPFRQRWAAITQKHLPTPPHPQGRR